MLLRNNWYYEIPFLVFYILKRETIAVVQYPKVKKSTWRGICFLKNIEEEINPISPPT